MAVVDPNDLFAFAARTGNKVIEAQMGMKAPLFDMLKKEKAEGTDAKVNIIAPGQESVTFIADNATIPAGSSSTPVQGVVRPVAALGNLEIGEIALNTLTGVADSANYLDLQLKALGNTLGQKVGQALFAGDGLIANVSAFTTSFASGSGTAVVTVDSVAGLKLNTTVELRDASGSGTADGYSVLMRIDGIAISTSNLTASISLKNLSSISNAVLDAAFVAGGVSGVGLYHRGTFAPLSESSLVDEADAGLRPVSLVDLAGTGAIYGLTANQCLANGFQGSSFTSVGAVTYEKISRRLVAVQNFTGGAPNLLVCNRAVGVELGFNAATAADGSFASGVTKMNTGKIDKYGPALGQNLQVAVSGIPILVDDNCSHTQMFGIDKDVLSIAQWKGVEPRLQSGSKELVSQTKYGRTMQFHTIYNVKCVQRNSVVRFSGITTGSF